ncbi:MAG: zf-HC2 domain-containing protein [Caldimonas sp.]
MKARILALDSDEHRLAQELLPWFVNGTLDAAEAAQVTAHLAHCSRCQADAAAHADLRAMTADAGPRGDVDRDWAALRSRLDAAPAAAPHRFAAAARPWWRQGLQAALALQAAVVLVLAVALVGVSSRTEPYRALGAAPASAEANALALFHADATEQQIRAALRAVDARIVGGPTVTDAYLVRLGDPGPDALARLRAQPGVLRVESLQGEASR